MFTDTHCHIYKEYYDDIDDIINKSVSNNITRFINNGGDSESNKEVIDLIEKYPNMYGTVGIHPEYVDSYEEEDLQFVKNALANPKVVAIGEIGLDYHYTKDNKEKQIELFEKQLKLAEEYHMPVIVHSREATEDVINCLKKYKVTGVIHSFSGSLETARIYEKMGFYFGINGVITFKNSKLKEVVKNIDISKIILETDSPYLTPEPKRGQKNDPSNIKHIASFIADLYKIDMKELSEITNKNVASIFDKMP